jgi:hypothetical protein
MTACGFWYSEPTSAWRNSGADQRRARMLRSDYFVRSTLTMGCHDFESDFQCPRTETAVIKALNAWIGDLFHARHVDRTVAALVASQDGARGVPSTREAASKRLADAEARLRRFQTAIAAGVDPAALVESINQAQAQRAAAQAELDGAPAPTTLTEADVYAMIDYLGDLGHALNQADPARLEELYTALRLDMTYDAEARAVDVTIRPGRRGSERVRGARCA